MVRLTRMALSLLLGGAALAAQIPNPLNLPDPLGLSKKPAPAPPPREGRRSVRRAPERDGDHHRKEGKHKGHKGRDKGKHKEKHGR